MKKTEPLVLTVYVCKLELRGKAIVLQSRFRRTRFSRGQQRTKRKEKTSFHKTKTNLGASAAAWFQGGTHFGQWRIQRWRIIRACSWKSLSPNIAFFCFLRSHYFFFSYWLLIHLEMKLCESWLNHEPLSLSARFCLLFERIKFSDFLLVWFWFCFAFYPRTFLRSGALYDDEMNWLSVTTVIQCKQKMLSSSNRVREKWNDLRWLCNRGG